MCLKGRKAITKKRHYEENKKKIAGEKKAKYEEEVKKR